MPGMRPRWGELKKRLLMILPSNEQHIHQFYLWKEELQTHLEQKQFVLQVGSIPRKGQPATAAACLLRSTACVPPPTGTATLHTHALHTSTLSYHVGPPPPPPPLVHSYTYPTPWIPQRHSNALFVTSTPLIAFSR